MTPFAFNPLMLAYVEKQPNAEFLNYPGSDVENRQYNF